MSTSYLNKSHEELETFFTNINAVATATTISASATAAALTVSGQIVNAQGDAVSGRFLIDFWFGEAANNGAPYDFGDVAAVTGSVIVKEYTTDALGQLLTKSDGTWGLTLTVASDDTVHSNAAFQGVVVATSTAVNVP